VRKARTSVKRAARTIKKSKLSKGTRIAAAAAAVGLAAAGALAARRVCKPRERRFRLLK
jgi:hypothetical protein